MIKFDVPIIKGSLEFDFGTDGKWRAINRTQEKAIEITDETLINILEHCILEELTQEESIEILMVSMINKVHNKEEDKFGIDMDKYNKEDLTKIMLDIQREINRRSSNEIRKGMI